jgi:transposase
MRNGRQLRRCWNVSNRVVDCPTISIYGLFVALQKRTRCQWRLLPANFTSFSSVRYYFDQWATDGTFIQLNDTLRKAARTALGGDEEPAISMLNPQSTKTTEAGGTRGINGKERSTDANVVLG